MHLFIRLKVKFIRLEVREKDWTLYQQNDYLQCTEGLK